VNMRIPCARSVAILILLVLTLSGGLDGQTERPARVGDVLPPWMPGTLDLHQITTGHGNAAFFRFPDGTTMLLDAGDSGGGVAHTEPRPDASRSPGEWISRYITHMVGGSNVRLDYAVLTHFHDDHMGGITMKSKPAASGDYLLSGVTEVGSIIPIG